jgi:uncharacterized protein (DUF1697 family)
MTTYAALLRGVNVGKNKLAMSDLRDLLTSLGCQDVRTYLQSGNAVLAINPAVSDATAADPTTLAQAIEQGLTKIGVSSRVLLRTGDELARVLADNPFLDRETDPTKLHVTFLADVPAADRVEKLQVPAGETASLHLQDKEVYLHCPDGYGRTKLTNSFVESRLATVATTRNWRTVLALTELAGG